LPTAILLAGTLGFAVALFGLWWRVTGGPGTALIATGLSLVLVVAAATFLSIVVMRG
jgi:uncharacterized membrane protein YedE/YeeE